MLTVRLTILTMRQNLKKQIHWQKAQQEVEELKKATAL